MNAGPASDAAVVTPSDETALTSVRGLYIGGMGDVVIDTANSTGVTFSTVPAGTILPIMATKVKAATTATLIVALKG